MARYMQKREERQTPDSHVSFWHPSPMLDEQYSSKVPLLALLSFLLSGGKKIGPPSRISPGSCVSASHTISCLISINIHPDSSLLFHPHRPETQVVIIRRRELRRLVLVIVLIMHRRRAVQVAPCRGRAMRDTSTRTAIRSFATIHTSTSTAIRATIIIIPRSHGARRRAAICGIVVAKRIRVVRCVVVRACVELVLVVVIAHAAAKRCVDALLVDGARAEGGLVGVDIVDGVSAAAVAGLQIVVAREDAVGVEVAKGGEGDEGGGSPEEAIWC